jgi:hypothetical protein
VCFLYNSGGFGYNSDGFGTISITSSTLAESGYEIGKTNARYARNEHADMKDIMDRRETKKEKFGQGTNLVDK